MRRNEIIAAPPKAYLFKFDEPFGTPMVSQVLAWIANRPEASQIHNGLPSFVADEMSLEKTIEIWIVQVYILVVAPQQKLKEVREKQSAARRFDGLIFDPTVLATLRYISYPARQRHHLLVRLT